MPNFTKFNSVHLNSINKVGGASVNNLADIDRQYPNG